MKFRFRYILALWLLMCLSWWLWPRPDTFFAKLSIDIPSEFIVSHRSPLNLMGENDEIILKIPRSRVAEVQNVLAAQKNFLDLTPFLPREYAHFRAGNEAFFPNCPKKFQAGRFRAFDHSRYTYGCRFLIDQDDPDFAFLYLDSVSGNERFSQK